jgi:hypothetical protein
MLPLVVAVIFGLTVLVICETVRWAEREHRRHNT